MGEHSLLQSDGQIEVGVESVVLHPQFSSITSDYDVALLLLAAPGGDWALWDRVSHSTGRQAKLKFLSEGTTKYSLRKNLPLSTIKGGAPSLLESAPC